MTIPKKVGERMKKTPLILTAILMAITANVWAGKTDQTIIKEAAQNNLSIAQAIKSPDSTAVTLTGTISAHIKDEHFELKDDTGSIGVEIDHDLATLQQLKLGTKVKLVGEVDTHRDKPTDIDVVKIEILGQ